MYKQILGASLAALSFASAPSLAQTWDFTAGKSYVFGDSLSDTGNVFLAAGAGGPPVLLPSGDPRRCQLRGHSRAACGDRNHAACRGKFHSE